MTDFTADLVLTNITKRYNDATILDDLSLTVQCGATLAIVGPSGSGKSTLLNIIGALDQPTSGVVHLGKTEITALEGKELARYRASSVGFVFQDHHLLPQLTAIENVLLPTLAVRRKADAAEALALLTRVGVDHRADAFPSQMSGGERQRVAIARALINKPNLLLCDEPTGNLDSSTGATVIELILEIAQQGNVTAMVVTHNPEHAARFGRCLTLHAGKLEAVNG